MGNPFKDGRAASSHPIPKWSEITVREVPYQESGAVAIVQDSTDPAADIVLLWRSFGAEGKDTPTVLDQIKEIREAHQNAPHAVIYMVRVENLFIYMFALAELLMQVHKLTPKPSCPGWYVIPAACDLSRLAFEMFELEMELREMATPLRCFVFQTL